MNLNIDDDVREKFGPELPDTMTGPTYELIGRILKLGSKQKVWYYIFNVLYPLTYVYRIAFFIDYHAAAR